MATASINKAKVRQRLSELGKLEEFTRVRDGYSRQFAQEGFSARDASHKAWEMATRFFLEPDHWTPKLDPRLIVETVAAAGNVPIVDPGAGKPEELPKSVEDAPAAFFAGKSKSNLRRDILWVYENMHVRGVKPQDAPSSGAWGLLVWVKRTTANETSFVGGMLKSLIAKEDDDLEQRITDDGRAAEEIIAEIRRLGSGSVHSPGTRDVGGEPGLPGEYAQVGVDECAGPEESLDHVSP